MKFLVSLFSLYLISLIFTSGCSHKVATADAAIAPSEVPMTQVTPTEEKVDKNALARIVNSDGKDTKKKVVKAKKVAKPVEPQKTAAAAAPIVPPPAASVPEQPKEAPKPIEANPEIGGFFSLHWPMAVVLGLAGLGSIYFLVFWKRREEKR